MTNRRLTHSAVAHTTPIGAPMTSNGNVANCALPEYTTSDINTAKGVLRPDFTIARPVTTPHAAMPGANGNMSRAPRRASGSVMNTRASVSIKGEAAGPSPAHALSQGEQALDAFFGGGVGR